MAIAKVKCTCTKCGKEYEWRVSRNNSTDARDWEAWISERIADGEIQPVCPQCWADEKKKKEENARNLVAQENGWATLEGSPKQIAWAEKIRLEFYEKIDNRVYEKALPNSAIRIARQVLQEKESAAYWIEERGRALSKDLNEVVEFMKVATNYKGE